MTTNATIVSTNGSVILLRKHWNENTNPKYRRTSITILVPSVFEEDSGGYAPAESANFDLFPDDVTDLIAALNKLGCI